MLLKGLENSNLNVFIPVIANVSEEGGRDEKEMKTLVFQWIPYLSPNSFVWLDDEPSIGLFYTNWGIYLEGVWLWRISGVALNLRGTAYFVKLYI